MVHVGGDQIGGILIPSESGSINVALGDVENQTPKQRGLGARSVLGSNKSYARGDEFLSFAQLGIGAGLCYMITSIPNYRFELLAGGLIAELIRCRRSKIIENADGGVQFTQLDLHSGLGIAKAGGRALALVMEETEQNQRHRGLQ